MATVRARNTAARGRMIKMDKFPPEIIRAWRKYTSAMGPKINAIKSAAGR